jgi:enoyl-CoA hydratase
MDEVVKRERNPFSRQCRIWAAIVITGSEKAFAAGADIKEMLPLTYVEAVPAESCSPDWDALLQRSQADHCGRRRLCAGRRLRTGDDVRFHCLQATTPNSGSPRSRLGVMPGLGGSQRLTRFVGKSKAMDMCLTGRMMDAAEAERSGLVSRVFPAAELIEEALKIAGRIADLSPLAVAINKEAVNLAYETTLTEALHFERRLFHSMFAFEDKREGMTAFVEKRQPNFRNK